MATLTGTAQPEALLTVIPDGADIAHMRGVDTDGRSIRATNFAAAKWIAEYERSVTHEIFVDRYLTDPDDAAANTVGIQEMINDLYASWVSNGSGGVLRFPPFIQYLLEGSHESGTIYNGTSALAESTGGLILKSGVSLIGPGRYSGGGIRMTDRTKTLIYLLEPEMCVVQGMELNNAWTVGLSGAGHGLLSMKRTINIDDGAVTHRVIYDDLYIHNVGSYGASLQNGRPNGCTISNIETEYTGADGVDLKGRYETDVKASMNNLYNVRVRNHGVRVTGSSGVDVRGEWHIDQVNVAEFGALNNALDYVGIRLRTKIAPTTEEDVDGSRSMVSNVNIDCSSVDPASLGGTGMILGSDDISITGVNIIGGIYGVLWTGNVNGNSNRSTLTGVHVEDATTYGFYIGSGTNRATLIGCSSTGSGTAGIRNEGDYTTIIGHASESETALSTSSGASPTQQVIGSAALLGGYGITTGSAAAGRVGITAISPVTDTDLEFSNKGAGLFRFNQSANAGAAAAVPANFTADRLWQVRLNGTVHYIPCRTTTW